MELSPVGLSFMLFSLPAPIPFDWQLAGIKKLDFAGQCFSHCALPSTGNPAGPLRSPQGGAGGRRGRRGFQEAGDRKQVSPWLPPSSWTFLRFVSLCFCVIAFGQKVPSIKDVCKPLTKMEGTVRSRGLSNT